MTKYVRGEIPQVVVAIYKVYLMLLVLFCEIKRLTKYIKIFDPIFRILSFSNLPVTQPKVVSFLINFAPISQTLRVFEPNIRLPRRLEKSEFLGTFL